MEKGKYKQLAESLPSHAVLLQIHIGYYFAMANNASNTTYSPHERRVSDNNISFESKLNHMRHCIIEHKATM